MASVRRMPSGTGVRPHAAETARWPRPAASSSPSKTGTSRSTSPMVSASHPSPSAWYRSQNRPSSAWASARRSPVARARSLACERIRAASASLPLSVSALARLGSSARRLGSVSGSSSAARLSRLVAAGTSTRAKARLREDLLEEQRVTAGRAGDLVAGGGAQRAVTTEMRQQRRRRLPLERFEHHRGGVELAAAPARPLLEQLGAGDRQQQHGRRPRPVDDVLDEVEQGRLGSVQVVEDDHRRAASASKSLRTDEAASSFGTTASVRPISPATPATTRSASGLSPTSAAILAWAVVRVSFSVMPPACRTTSATGPRPALRADRRADRLVDPGADGPGGRLQRLRAGGGQLVPPPLDLRPGLPAGGEDRADRLSELVRAGVAGAQPVGG